MRKKGGNRREKSSSFLQEIRQLDGEKKRKIKEKRRKTHAKNTHNYYFCRKEGKSMKKRKVKEKRKSKEKKTLIVIFTGTRAAS